MGLNRNGATNSKLQVTIQPNIGLDGDARHSVVEILNTFLADEAILAMKTRSAHWHMRGLGFHDLRILYDQQFHQLTKLTDEIAERVGMLGGFAVSSFEEILHYTRLLEQAGVAPDMMGLLADHEATIRFLREDARKCFEEFEDHGTYALFVRFIRLHEKMAWILRSSIEPELARDERL